LHQAAIVVYPVVKDFGRIVRPHNYKIEDKEKEIPVIRQLNFSRKKEELILRVIKVNPLRNGIQVCDPRLRVTLLPGRGVSRMKRYRVLFDVV
jgi:hypothetical protein